MKLVSTNKNVMVREIFVSATSEISITAKYLCMVRTSICNRKGKHVLRGSLIE